MEKSTKITGVIIAIILVIIALLLIFVFLGGMTSTITDSANSAYYPNTCSETTDSDGIALNFNLSGLNCYNSSGANTGAATIVRLPLTSVFSASGVLLLILMAAIFIAVFLFLMRMWKR